MVHNEINLLGFLHTLEIKIFPIYKLDIKVILTEHITSQSCLLLFHGGDLVSLITFEGTILDQDVSCFGGKCILLVFQSVM